MKFILIVLLIFGIIMLLLAFIYFFLLFKLKHINDKFFPYKMEEKIEKENILIIYQPSRHGTIFKIKDLIKENITRKGYGYKIHTLSKKRDEYASFKYTIFVAPVYFGEVNKEFRSIVSENNFKNLIIIYNGMNDKSNNENNLIKDSYKGKYKWTKLHTQDLELLEDFLNKEVL